MGISFDINKGIEQTISGISKAKEIKNTKDAMKPENIVEAFMSNHSYEFDVYMDKLIAAGKNWSPAFNDGEWIGWHLFMIDGEYIPVIQEKKESGECVYRINPIYYDAFSKYFDENIRPQL